MNIVIFREPKIGKGFIYSFENKGIYSIKIDVLDNVDEEELLDVIRSQRGGNYTINDFINYLTYVGSTINGLSFPAVLSIEVTTRCNLSCRHCYVEGVARPSSVEIPANKWIELINKLSGKTVMIDVSGGEPLLKEGIEHILSAAKRAGLIVKLITNGTLLERKLPMLIKILDPKTDTIQVSLDGTEEIHDKIRGKGTYRKVIKGISKASKHFNIIISYTLMKINLDTVIQTYKIVSELGVSEFKLGLCRPIGACRDWVPYSIFIKKIEELLNIEKEVGIPVSPKYVKKDPSSVDLTKPLYTCPAGISMMSIAHNGDAYPCIIFRPYLRLGNVFEESIESIWSKADRVRKILLRDLSKTKCTKCPYAHICMGGCPAIAYHVYRNTSMEDPQCDIEV